jgi:hypothetical protein
MPLDETVTTTVKVGDIGSGPRNATCHLLRTHAHEQVATRCPSAVNCRQDFQ